MFLRNYLWMLCTCIRMYLKIHSLLFGGSSDNCINLLHDVKLSKEISIDVLRQIYRESDKTGSRTKSNPGQLACTASSLPLSYYNHPCTGCGTEMLQLHTWQLLSMCCPNSVRG